MLYASQSTQKEEKLYKLNHDASLSLSLSLWYRQEIEFYVIQGDPFFFFRAFIKEKKKTSF